jgi:hypothetical protein
VSSPEVPKQTTKLLLALELLPTLNYTKEEEQWAKDEKGIKEKGGWWKLLDQRLFVPRAVAAPLIKQSPWIDMLPLTLLRAHCTPRLWLLTL